MESYSEKVILIKWTTTKNISILRVIYNHLCHIRLTPSTSRFWATTTKAFIFIFKYKQLWAVILASLNFIEFSVLNIVN